MCRKVAKFATGQAFLGLRMACRNSKRSVRGGQDQGSRLVFDLCLSSLEFT